MKYTSVILFVAALTAAGCSPDGAPETESPEAGVAAPGEGAEIPGEQIPGLETETRNQEEVKPMYFEIETTLGSMVARLYDETPQHRDNFAKLVEEGFYDGTTFHRVIPSFMIQGGDPNSKDDDPMNDGAGGPGYTIPAEFSPDLFHKKGAIAAARQGDGVNPERRSSGSQFYIVQGRVFDEAMLDGMEPQVAEAAGAAFQFSEEARAAYTSIGGYPPLDMGYTVFGEIVDGLDVLDRIAATPTTGSQQIVRDRPLSDVSMTIRAFADYEPGNDTP